jgi:CubicO group peptidase (beta-lactamase class C family)
MATTVTAPNPTAPDPATTTTEAPTTTTVPEGTWHGAGTPESQGMDPGVLADLIEYVTTTYPNIDALAVARNGTVVLDAAFYPHEAEIPHTVYSVTKSVVSTLIGIAIERGLLSGVDVPVVEVLADHFPDQIDDLKAAMTIENVLTMSTGLECRDSYLYRWQGLGEMRASDDWAGYVLGLPMSEEPGTRFEYCNGASHVLSTILTEVTGGPASAFAAETLFGPLGIEDVTWREGPNQVSQGWAGISLRPADMVKIGWLYLQGGVWDGERILPAGYVEAATTPHVEAGTAADGYGYQWWVNDGTVAAIGYGGQYILLVPGHDLVVAFVSGLGRNPAAPESLLERYIIPAIVSDDPLAPDPDGAERLEAVIAVAAEIPEAAALPIPAAAEVLDEMPYLLGDNPGGFQWFLLDFEDDSLTMALEDVDGPIEVAMAFDGRYHESDAWGRTWAFRPEWTTDNTLTIDFRIVGGTARGHFEFVVDDDEVYFWYEEEVFGTSVLAAAKREAPALEIPTLPAPTVDGTFAPGEWDGALQTTLDNGSVASWLHADGDLYVAVASEDGGAANLVIAEGNRIRFLHSSAALGSAEYELADGQWMLARDFEWCCRRTSDAAEADALFDAEGWLANITYTGPPGEVEFMVEWPEEGALVAISLIPASGPVAFWPAWLDDPTREALYGVRQDVEVFGVDRWVTLRLAAG